MAKFEIAANESIIVRSSCQSVTHDFTSLNTLSSRNPLRTVMKPEPSSPSDERAIARSIRLKTTMTASNILKPSDRYCLRPSPIIFNIISNVKRIVKEKLAIFCASVNHSGYSQCSVAKATEFAKIIMTMKMTNYQEFINVLTCAAMRFQHGQQQSYECSSSSLHFKLSLFQKEFCFFSSVEVSKSPSS